MKASRLQKAMIAQVAEERFRDKFGMSRQEWILSEMKNGLDPKVAEKESRRLAKEAVDEFATEMAARGRGF